MINQTDTKQAMIPRNLTSKISRQRVQGERSPLGRDDWSHLEQYSLERFSQQDWDLLNEQRQPYMAEEKHVQVIEMLLVQQNVPSFGYQINNFEHCLQAATLAMKDHRSVDTIVVALFHDLGFTVCNESHGDFSAELLKPYVPDRHIWMLRRHMYFQYKYCPGIEGLDHDYASCWKSHENFEWSDEFVYKYDVAAMNADFKNAPIEEFIPLVREVFSRDPKQFEPEINGCLG